jgi:hypothetical protein
MKEVAERLMRWADRDEVMHFGISLQEKNRNQTSTVLKVVARRNEETDEVVLHLWDVDPIPFATKKKDINFFCPVDDPKRMDNYEEFVASVNELPLSRVARLYGMLKGLRFFEPTVENTYVIGYDGTKYPVEWISGAKKSEKT